MNRAAMIGNFVKEVIRKGAIDDVFLRNRPAPWDDENLDRLYEKSDLVYICISTTARAISQIPLIFLQKNKKNKWEKVPEEDPRYSLLHRPNYMMDMASFVEATVSWLLLDGNIYYIPWPMQHLNPTGLPDSMWPVAHRYMKAVKGSSGNLIGWNYNPDGNTNIAIPLSSTCHIFFWNPYDPIVGFAPSSAGKIAITTDYKAAKFNQLFFKQGTSIGGVVSTDADLTSEQVFQIQGEIDKKYAGIEKSHKLLVLYGGLKYTATSPTHKDMMWNKLRDMDKERILQIYGMKKSIISVTDDVNYATSREQRKSWWQDTNLPIMKMICSALNFTYFQNEQIKIAFDISKVEALQEAFSEKVDTAEKLVKMGFTPNEVNEKLELGFMDATWRNYIFVPGNYIAIGPDTELPQAPDPDATEETPTETPPENNDSEDTEEDLIEGEDLLSAEKAEPFVLTQSTSELEGLSEKPFNKLKLEAKAIYEAVGRVGIETISGEIGVAFDPEWMARPEAVAFIERKLIQLTGMDGIRRPVTSRLNKEIQVGLEKGENISEIAARIKKVFQFTGNRAKMIARTESYGALNFSRNSALKDSPFEEKRWVTSLDEKVRGSHQAMAGMVIKTTEFWDVNGSILQYPGDPSGAAKEVINCRCIEIPLIGKKVIGEGSWKEVIRKVNPLEKKFESKIRRAFFEFRVAVLYWLYDQQKR